MATRVLYLILPFDCLMMLKTLVGFKLLKIVCFTEPSLFAFPFFFPLALVFSYDFHAGAETMFSRHFNDPAADSYFTKRKWGELILPPTSYRNRPSITSPDTRIHASASHILSLLVCKLGHQPVSIWVCVFLVCFACGCAHIRRWMATRCLYV